MLTHTHTHTHALCAHLLTQRWVSILRLCDGQYVGAAVALILPHEPLCILGRGCFLACAHLLSPSSCCQILPILHCFLRSKATRRQFPSPMRLRCGCRPGSPCPLRMRGLGTTIGIRIWRFTIRIVGSIRRIT